MTPGMPLHVPTTLEGTDGEAALDLGSMEGNASVSLF